MSTAARPIFRAFLLIASAAAALSWACAQSGPAPTVKTASATAPAAPPAAALYHDANQPLETRARDLLARMTLDEKIAVIHGETEFSTAPLPRLGIPRRWFSDGPQGVREEVSRTIWDNASPGNDFATALPADVGLAATFDPKLARAYGNVIGEEALARGKHIMLGPAINIMRTPLNGRNSEYFGEDPYLASRMAVAYIQAVQAHGVASCAKHFAGNNQETQRTSINVEMDDRTLHEIYLPAFKAAVTEAHVWTVMSAYNRFRGNYCSASGELLTKILKQGWGFPGAVMSDWGGTHATTAAANAGLDLEMGTGKYFLPRAFQQALERGEISRERLDDMVLRNLRVMVATGLCDDPGQREKGSMNTPEHQAMARDVQDAAIVLLKNEKDLLPLDSGKIKSLAVIGANAKTRFARDGGSATIKAPYEITPLEGITKRAGAGVTVAFAQGYVSQPRRERRRPASQPAASLPATSTAEADAAARAALLDEAAQAAASADVAIVVVGPYRYQDQEGVDRVDMKLPAGQDEVVERVVAANPRTIVVLGGGGPLEMDRWLSRTPAVLMTWYGGMEGGNALARVLFGDVNPSGKLPCTFPHKLADSPAHALNAYPGRDGQEKYEEGLLVGYRWFDSKGIEPLFPFGFGLSYTKFEISDLRLAPAAAADAEVPADPSSAATKNARSLVTAQVQVANTGSRAGAEVVQVYIEDGHSALPRPKRELKGFEKVYLKAGEKKSVSLDLPIDAFAYYDPAAKAWRADAGNFTICIGTSSRELPLRATYHRAQSVTFPDGP